jgi:MFS family permease
MDRSHHGDVGIGGRRNDVRKEAVGVLHVALLLGMAEAGFAPGVVYYFTLWFPQSEQARAFSRFCIAFPISNVVAGVVSGPLLSLQGRAGLAGWQWLFLLEALPAIVLSIVVFFKLPDGPAAAHWLSDEERAWIVTLLQEESEAKTGTSHETVNRATTRCASLDGWTFSDSYICRRLFLQLYSALNDQGYDRVQQQQSGLDYRLYLGMRSFCS